MKLKAPKPWQMIVILVTVFVLAIAGVLIYVYVSTGFKQAKTYPAEIKVESVSGNYSEQTGQFEVTGDFVMKISSPTENITEKSVTLGFKAGVSVTRDELNGTISDGNIIVPEYVTLDEEFAIQIVQAPYFDQSGVQFVANKGGVSELTVTSANNLLPSISTKIAVDVPVKEIGLELFNATTGDKIGEIGKDNEIAEETNFETRPVFYPSASKYLFSDDKNSAIEAKREKLVFFEVDSAATGVSFMYNNGDVYFVAGTEPSASNLVSVFTFKNATEQIEFLATHANITGLPLYNEAISVLSSQPQSITSSVNIAIVEANVGSFNIIDTSAAPMQLVTNKLFRLSAGVSALSNRDLSIVINDIHGNNLSSMIKNVGLRILSVTDKNSGSNVSFENVSVKGGKTITVGSEDFVLINSAVKDLKQAFWEIAAKGEYNIEIEVALLLKDKNGQLFKYQTPQVQKVHFSSTEHVEENVSWQQGFATIAMTIIYAQDGTVISSQYQDNLIDKTEVPATNTYQKRVFFVYDHKTAQAEAGKTIDDYIELSTIGRGKYNLGDLASPTLYPLQGSELIVKGGCEFKLVFATVRTDAYGNAIMTSDGQYSLIKFSTPVEVTVKETLHGIASDNFKFDFQQADSEFNDDVSIGRKEMVLPAGTKNAINFTITLSEGDGAIFDSELQSGKIRFFASEDRDGKIERTDVFDFDPKNIIVNGNTVTGTIDIKNTLIENAEGQTFYICVGYDNSSAPYTVVSSGVSGNDEWSNAVRVYNQTAKTITNSSLANKTCTVNQNLASDGGTTFAMTITDMTTPPATAADFNTLLKTNTEIKDVFDRKMQSTFTVSSSSPGLVIVSAENDLSFSTGNGRATITVSAGSANYTFTCVVESKGVTKITVDGEEAPNLGSPSKTVVYTPGGNYLEIPHVLKDILKVYVPGESGGEALYEDTAYKIHFSEAFLTEVENTNLFDMFEIKDSNGGVIDTNQTPSTEISNIEIASIALTKHLGQDVTLRFSATNKTGTLNFTFLLMFTKSAIEQSNNLSLVDYGMSNDTKEQVTGVREQDYPKENLSQNQIAVYAGFGINLSTYLPVSNVNWAGVYGAATNVEDGGITYGNIEGGILTFNDVAAPTPCNFTFYSVEGNANGFMKQVSFVIVPNVFIQNKGDISLLAIMPEKTNYTNSFDYERIVGPTTKEEKIAFTEGIYTGFVFSEHLQDIKFKTNPADSSSGQEIVIFNGNTIEYAYGEFLKQVTLTLKSGAADVVSSTVNIALDISTAALGATCGDWLADTISYNNHETIIVPSQGSKSFTGGTFFTPRAEGSGLTAALAYNPNAYDVSGTGDLRRINFYSAADELLYGPNYYVQINFLNAENSDVAIIKIPIIISSFGDKFAVYDEGSSLDDILTGKATTGTSSIDVNAGETYSLLAPETLSVNNTAYSYLIAKEGGSLYPTFFLLSKLVSSKTSGNNQVVTFSDANGVKSYFICEVLNDTLVALIECNENGVASEQAARYELNWTANKPQTIDIAISGLPLAPNTYVVRIVNGVVTICEEAMRNADSITNFTGTFETNGSSGGTTTLATFTIGWDKTLGYYLKQFNDQKFISGLSAIDFGSTANVQILAEVVNSTADLAGIDKLFTIKDDILTIGNLVKGVSNLRVPIKFTLTSGANTLEYYYFLNVTPNATLSPVVYPNEVIPAPEGTVELLNIPNEQTKEINLDDVFAPTAKNLDKKRFPDIATLEGKTDMPLTDGIYSYELRIGGVVISQVEQANAGFIVRLETREGSNTYLIMENTKNVTGVELSITKTYPTVFNITTVNNKNTVVGASLVYEFSINPSDVDYFVAFSEPKIGVDSTWTEHKHLTSTTENNQEVWTLSELTTDSNYRVNATTKLKNEMGGSSNVDTKLVTTILTTDIVAEKYIILTGEEVDRDTKISEAVAENRYIFIYNHDPDTGTPYVEIRVPGFVDQDATRKLFFTANGFTTTLNIEVKATVTATWTTQLYGGQTYPIADFVTLSDQAITDGYTISSLELVNSANFISIDNPTADQITVDSLKETGGDVKFKITYSDGTNTGYATGSVSFYPNILDIPGGAFTVPTAVTAGETLTLAAQTSVFNLASYPVSVEGETPYVPGIGNFWTNVKLTKFTPKDLALIKEVTLVSNSSAQNAPMDHLQITTGYVPSETNTEVDVTLTYTRGDYNFTITTKIKLTLTPAAELTVNYPSPSGGALTYESLNDQAEATITVGGASVTLASRLNTGNVTDGADNKKVMVYNGVNGTFLRETAGSIYGTININGVAGINNGTYGYIISKADGLVQRVFALQSGEITNGTFFNLSPDFAKDNNLPRVTFNEITESETFNQTALKVTALEEHNIFWHYDDETGQFTVAKGIEGGESSVRLQLQYKGVLTEYLIFCFDNVVSSSIQKTINYNESESAEYVYPDRVAGTNLFELNRLMKISVDQNAVPNKIYSIYSKPSPESKFEKLISFKMKQEYIGRSIFVDIGIAGYKQIISSDVIFYDESQPLAGGAFATLPGVTFERFAGRVEYHYATADGTKILITHDSLKINATPTSAAGADISGTYSVSYKLNGSGAAKGTVEFKVVQKLDIAVERAYNESNPTVIDIQTNKINHYKLVDLAGIVHPSTGEQISAASIAAGAAQLSLEVVPMSGNQRKIKVGDQEINFKDNSDLTRLSFATISESSADPVYDFFIVGEGASNLGDYILVKFTYAVPGQSQTFEIAFRLLPDYEVALGGNIVAHPVQVGETPAEAIASNAATPLVIIPVAGGTLTLAGSGNSDAQVSFIRKNLNNVNISYALSYEMQFFNSGEKDYNIDKGKAMPNNWTQDSHDLDNYTITGNSSKTISLTLQQVVFGEKKYMISITNDFGYQIELHFVLRPADNNTPQVNESASDTSFTEGDAFDIGLVHDKIAVTPGEGNNSATFDISRQQVPTSETVKKIILQNIQAYGFTTSGYPAYTYSENKVIQKNVPDGYEDLPLFTDVDINSISFQYDANEPAIGTTIMTNKLTSLGGATGLSAFAGQTIEISGYSYIVDFKQTEGKTYLTLTETYFAEMDTGTNLPCITIAGAKYYYYSSVPGSKPDNFGKTLVDLKPDTLAEYDQETGFLKVGDNKLYSVSYNSEGMLVLSQTYTGKTVENAAQEQINLNDGSGLINYVIGKATTEDKYKPNLATGIMYYNTPSLDQDGSPNITAEGEVETNNNQNEYRDLVAGNFTVPVLPGWIYGTGDTANVNVIITLVYKANDREAREYCTVSLPVQVRKQAQFSSNLKVVVDGEPFDLLTGGTGDTATKGKYFDVSNALPNGKALSIQNIFDDTLVVTNEKNGGYMTLDVAFKDINENIIKQESRTITNSNSERRVSEYISLSEMLGRPLDNTITAKVTWSGSANSTVFYAGKSIMQSTEAEEKAETIAFNESNRITTDTLYIEDAGRILNNQFTSVKKSYIVQTNDNTFYRYEHEYQLTSKYSVLDDGLGDRTYKTITVATPAQKLSKVVGITGQGKLALRIEQGVDDGMLTAKQETSRSGSIVFNGTSYSFKVSNSNFTSWALTEFGGQTLPTPLTSGATLPVGSVNTKIHFTHDGILCFLDDTADVITATGQTPNGAELKEITIGDKTYNYSYWSDNEHISKFYEKGTNNIGYNKNIINNMLIKVGNDNYVASNIAPGQELKLTKCIMGNVEAKGIIEVEGVDYSYTLIRNSGEDWKLKRFRDQSFTPEKERGEGFTITVFGQDAVNGYVIPFGVWANGIKVAKAQDAGALEYVSLNTLDEETLKAFKFTISTEDTNSTASFGDDGRTLYSGKNYTLDNDQYIYIKIYVKASGGPSVNFGASKYDKLLGSIRIFLSETTVT